MSGEQLAALKEQLAGLSWQQKLELAGFLEEQVARGPAGGASELVPDQDAGLRRAQHMAWLKAHREEYTGRYVALDGKRFVGSGATIRQAHEEARKMGVEHPFLTHISSASDAPFGGW